ncbi:MAG: glucosamine-6-phosphate deaminase [Hyphomicrobiales bacterium]
MIVSGYNEIGQTVFERMPVHVFNDSSSASIDVARMIADLIKTKQDQNENCILGLATGSSPVKVYEELARIHKEEGLSFRNVITFNLDEYYPMQPDAIQSYHRFMHEHLFNHIDIPEENIHIPDGTVEKSQIANYCHQYEQAIEDVGGIDLQLLGIGRTGHIGFNEPGSSSHSKTRLITLDHITRIDASSDFFGEENVPRNAITMGVGSILKAKKLILLAWGENKSPIIKRAVEGEISDTVPTTYLQKHHDINIYLDKAAAAELTRIKTPWVVRECEWTDRQIRKAVVWLCQKVDKPILKLTDRDYNDNHMSDLLATYGPSNRINIQVFNDLQHTITGWPGGKPNADDSHRPERANPYPKRVIVFSPHPDDDVISMGGTFIRLVEQGHDVHVAYQTSGNIAVFDDDVLKYLDFVDEYIDMFDTQIAQSKDIHREVADFIKNKQPAQLDNEEMQKIKSAIRKGEARSACRYVGIKSKNIHFLDMPFYETGKVRKKPLGEDDYNIIIDLLQKIQPHQIYAAGDLSDPHGTHRVCLKAIVTCLDKLKNEKWMKDCNVWLYRGAWQEWDVDIVDMAVPISPEELLKKRNAIFRHQSQKDRPLFPGTDDREFWQRAEARNRATAQLYDKFGMAEYEAMELFVKVSQDFYKMII